MDISDAAVGKTILTTTTAIFVLLAVWVNTYPFIDEDLPVYRVIPDPQWFLLCCAAWGSLFIGGLVAFTLYHVLPGL